MLHSNASCTLSHRQCVPDFQLSTVIITGSECIGLFQKMSECMSQYPDLYPENQDEDDAKLETAKESSIDASNSQSSDTDSDKNKSRKSWCSLRAALWSQWGGGWVYATTPLGVSFCRSIV